jgi:pimeloyl-ACP methyl ester carboxylesterase
MLRVARFLRGYLRHPLTGGVVSEVMLPHGTDELPATFIRPAGGAVLPGWILLHGVTVPGRHHPLLTRFAHALSSSGAAVLIPEVSAWRQLRLEASAGDAAVAASVTYLGQREDVQRDLNLVGFSFGATHALMSAARETVRHSVRGVLGFGGYCDLRRSLHCMMTGEHEWNGVRRRLEPDPYGRWIVVANFIDLVPEFAHMVELKQAAHELASESGRMGVYAAEPVYDDQKAALRRRLPNDQREIWDIVAPPFGVTPAADRARELSDLIGTAAATHSPGLDPGPWLPHLDQRVVLAHGRDDRLIPFTETLRLAAALPPAVSATVSITRLFAHSSEADRLAYLAYPREAGRYFALLRRALQPA